jgi:transcription termination factor Rho
MSIQLSSLRSQALSDLVLEAQESGIDNAGNLQPSELIFELVRLQSSKTDTIIGDGFLEVLSDGFGFLRSSVSFFAPGVDDIYVSPSQIRRFNLRSGDWVEGKIRIPREGERYLALLQIHSVNGQKPDKARNRLRFSSLQTAIDKSRIEWKSNSVVDGISKAVDMGYGDRLVIHTPGVYDNKDFILSLFKGIEAVPVFVLIGASPMVIEQYKHYYQSEMFCSLAGSDAERHVQAAEFGLLRAKRIAEQQNNVILVISSLSLLMRAYRDVSEQSGQSGPSSRASTSVRRAMGHAQGLERGGSITTVGFLADLDHPIDVRLFEDISAEQYTHLVLDSEMSVDGDEVPIDLDETQRSNGNLA